MATATRTRLPVGLAVAAGLLLVLGLVLLAAVLGGSQSQCDSASGPGAVGGAPSTQGRKAIPADLYPVYLRAQQQYGVPWNVFAGINYVETDFGRSDLPGVHSGTNYAGAAGPMQFLGSTWASYGVDGNGDGHKNVFDAADAIPAAGRYLKASGAPGDIRGAIFAYNHAGWYVDEVLAEAKALTQGGTLVASTTATSGAGAATCDAGAGAVGPANLDQAVQLSSPQRFATLPGRAMAGGRSPEQVDARILPDVEWVLRRYDLRVSAARETGHHTHGDGTATDLVPASGSSQATWDATTRRLAIDLGWTPECASSGVAPVCPLKPAIRGVFYDGYPGHGDPAHVGANAHIHVSWYAAHFGASGLAPPNVWVRVFPVPAEGDEGGAGATPVSGSRPAGASMLMVGDSLAEGTGPELPDALPGWTIQLDARVGRPLDEGTREVERLHPSVSVLAVSLFTNDDPRHVDELTRAVRASLRGQRCVVWATIQRPPVAGVSYAAANRAGSYPGRLWVVDWAGAVARHPAWLGPDRVHATPAGWAARARMYAAAARRCTS